MLSLHPRSMIAPLLTETGTMPLRVRRFLLTLTHLAHWIGLDKKHFARAALDSSIELSAMGKRCWVKDLTGAASRLPFQCPELTLSATTTVEDIQNYTKKVDTLNTEWLQSEIDSSDKLYLLRGRLEPQKDKPPMQVTSEMRHYLKLVKTQAHREALTSLLSTPRENRLCRLCKREVETLEHALLTCRSSAALVELRPIFLEQLFMKCSNLQRHLVQESNTEFLKTMIYPGPVSHW
ncbi:hypothetical protein B0H10DRAFT_1825847 [Mycena sp. CBHHK59/15]|nr:hypothetical protein B0H10DRAFT_1825847 [Mycena sp. CBHHK59/15]